MSVKHIYGFGPDMTDGDAEMKNLLGGKGANLAEMSKLDIPVPPGFTITTEVCTYFNEKQQSYPEDLEAQMKSSLKDIEKRLGTVFGDPKNPLLSLARRRADKPITAIKA